MIILIAFFIITKPLRFEKSISHFEYGRQAQLKISNNFLNWKNWNLYSIVGQNRICIAMVDYPAIDQFQRMP